MCLVHRNKRLRPNSQNLRKTSSPGSNGLQVLARPRFLQTASRTFNAARPIDIMAATTSFSWGRSRPMRTSGKRPCCLLAAVTEPFSPTTFLGPKGPNDKESIPHARSCQAEAAIAGRPPQGVRCQGDRILLGRRIWGRDPRSGAAARRHPAATVSLLSEQGRADQGGLSDRLSRAARYRLGEAAGRPLPANSRSAAGILQRVYQYDLHP